MGLICKAWGTPPMDPGVSGRPITRYPTELTFGLDSEPAVRGRSRDMVVGNEVQTSVTMLECIHTWEAVDEKDAWRHFRWLVARGVPQDRHSLITVPGTQVWRFRGSRAFLSRQSARIGVPEAALASVAAYDNKQLRSINNSLTQLSEEYHATYENGRPVILPYRQQIVRGILMRVEMECRKIHAQAAAAAAMLDEAWTVHGMDPPDRGIAVLSDNDGLAHVSANGFSHAVEAVEPVEIIVTETAPDGTIPDDGS